jgi:hypothetical protein
MKLSPSKELLISMLKGKPSIIPIDMDGTVHHPIKIGSKDTEVILVYYGATTAHLEEGNVCIRGHRLIADVSEEVGNMVCLVVKIKDTSGEE